MKKGDLSILSIYTIEEEDGCNGEEVIKDDTEDVEAKAILNTEIKSLQKALAQLDIVRDVIVTESLDRAGGQRSCPASGNTQRL